MFSFRAREDQCASSVAAPTRAARVERLLARFRPHLLKAQVLMLLLFLGILLTPLLVGETAFGPGPFEDVGAIAGLLLWGVWLPAVLVSAVLAGRAWCGLLCPMGAATEWMSRIGLNRPIPGWLKWSGLPLASFLVISLLNEATGADDDPVALAILFGSLFFVAITVGFLFGRDKRAWCRHACPIGMTLGLSARLSGVSFEPKHQRAGGEHYTEKTVCPTMIDLKRKTETRHCLVCAKCIAPDARGGLRIAFRRLGTEIKAVARSNPSLVEVLFLFSAIGIATGVTLEDLPAVDAWRHGGTLGQGFLATLAYFAVITAAVVAVLSGVAAIAAAGLARGRIATAWRGWFFRLGYGIAPLAIASLLFCMCAVAFEGLAALGIAAEAISVLKAVIVLGALSWSGAIIHGSSAPRAVDAGAPSLAPAPE